MASEGDGTALPIVAVDIDEVLGTFVEALCEFHNEEYGTSLSVADFHSYHFSDVWGGSDENAMDKVHKFLESKYFEDLPVLEGALSVFRSFSRKFRFVCVTSRQHAIEQQTRQWLDRHFADVFESVHFGNHYGVEGTKRSKSEICKELGAVVLIDDSAKYAKEAAPHVPHIILFGDYAWNKMTDEELDTHPNIVRVPSWYKMREVLQELNDLLSHRDSIAVSLKRTAQFYANTARRLLKYSPTVSITATGTASAAVVETVDILKRHGDVTVISIRTSADSAPVPLAREIRLTATLQRTPQLLANVRRATMLK